MAKFFKRKKKEQSFPDKKEAAKPLPRKVDDKDLIDPVLYLGGLDESKYPFLPLENKKKKPEEEIENPLNKR